MMNERIKQLADQAGINCVVPAVGSLEYPSKGEIEHLKKFAELIVQQCIDAVENTNDRYRKDYFANKIRQHFGVES